MQHLCTCSIVTVLGLNIVDMQAQGGDTALAPVIEYTK